MKKSDIYSEIIDWNKKCETDGAFGFCDVCPLYKECKSVYKIDIEY